MMLLLKRWEQVLPLLLHLLFPPHLSRLLLHRLPLLLPGVLL